MCFCVSAYEHIWDVLEGFIVSRLPAGILEQSAVWVDEMNYDMRRDRNKGLSPLSLGPGNPLGIEIDKYGSKTFGYTPTCAAQSC